MKRFKGQLFENEVNGVVVDRHGNTYVAGEAWITPGPDTVALSILAKSYSPKGELRWSYGYGRSGFSFTEVNDVAIDRDGNFIITGETYSGKNGSNFITIKLAPSGKLKWKRQFGGVGAEAAEKVVIGRNNAVLVTGPVSDSDIGGASGVVTIKYSAGGIRRWIMRYNTGIDSLPPGGMAADNRNGSIYVVSSNWWDDHSGIVTVKYKQ